MRIKEVTCYGCGVCGKIYLNKHKSQECCSDKIKPTCNVCGCEIEFYRTICDKCLNEKRFNEAEKINYIDYKVDCLYDENSERYFCDIEEMEEYYYDLEDGEMPKWAFACDFEKIELDAGSILQRETEDHHEDAYDSLVDVDEFHIFIDKWSKKQTGGTYYQDYKKVVLFE